MVVREKEKLREEGGRMCEQQRCISVQRSIHRVEVNARPYTDPRKEREGGKVGGSSGRRGGTLHGREGGAAERRAHERGVEKMNKHPARWRARERERGE